STRACVRVRRARVAWHIGCFAMPLARRFFCGSDKESVMKAITCTMAALVLIGGAACGDDDDNQSTGDAGATASAANLTVKHSDIASDKAGALALDKTLKNAWGLAFNPQGAAWVSSNGTGTSKVYNANGDQALADVKIPAPGKGVSAPTGQVFNDNEA